MVAVFFLPFLSKISIKVVATNLLGAGFENGKKPRVGDLEIEFFLHEEANERGWRGSGLDYFN